MPGGVRLCSVLFLAFGLLPLMAALAMPFDGMDFTPAGVRPALGAVFMAALMLTAGEGLRRLRKWGALCALLFSAVMTIPDIWDAQAVVRPLDAAGRMIFVAIVALWVLPSWNEMTWAPPALPWVKRPAGA